MSFNFGGGNPPAFGAPNPAAGSITFGTPIAQPQAGGLFGAPVPSAVPNFGFGAPASSASSFGSGSINTGLNFGTPASTGLSFGAPASTGLSFGAPASTGLSFGTPAVSGGLNFGAPASAVSSSFNFGAPAPTLGAFGSQASSAAPTLNFGAPKATGALNFGAGNAATGGLGFGGAPVPTMGFGLSSANQITSLLGATTTTPSTGGLNFGFGGGALPGQIGSTLGGFGLASKTLTSTTTSMPSSVGLGGVATCTPLLAKFGGVATCTTTAARTEISAKDQPLPNEILQTVEAFKAFIKQQEQYCSDISKVSIKEFKKVKEDIDSVKNKLTTTEKQLQSNKVTAQKLKYDTAKGLQQIEMAQRTHDTPPGLQYDNNAPLLFFIELVDSFEKEMQQIKLQIETTDKYVRNLGAASPLTSNDLSLGLRRLHDTFVALAGRLQSIHSQVEYHKEQYLNYRRYMLRDEETVTNVFERPNAEADALQIALRSMDAYHGLSGVGGGLGRLSVGADDALGKDNPLALISSISSPATVSSGPTPFGTSLDQSNVVQVQHQQQLQLQQQQQAVQAGLAGGAMGGGGLSAAALPSFGGGLGVSAPIGPPPPYPGTGLFGAGTAGLLSGSATTNTFGSPAAITTLGSLATSPNPLGGFSLSHGSTFPLQKPPVGNKRGKP